ncbi:MAG: type II secretion system protein M [Sulfuricellaceae bacterium]|nr:type II secretion system protein M [Sulfuricellaceae bacterium]
MLCTKFDTRAQRERSLIFLTAILAVMGIIYLAAIEPAQKKFYQASSTLEEKQNQLSQVRSRIETLKSPYGDPDYANRERLKFLKKEDANNTELLKNVQKSLVPPGQMADLIESMLNRNRQVKLVALKTLPAIPLLKKASTDTKGKAASQISIFDDLTEKPASEQTLYRHTIEMTLEGSYLDLMRYLSELENLSWKMYWESVKLDVTAYPRSRLTIRVYTLSLDKVWLSV